VSEHSFSHLKAVTIAGTRPEIIKLSEFVKRIKQKSPDHCLLYTGQHFSNNMKDVFFDDLGIVPDLDLNCSTSDVPQLKQKLLGFFKNAKPEYVIVYGDTYSTMAATLAAQEQGIKIIHLEAGIRDLDTSIPEERVRMYVDSVADHLLAPTELAKTFLMYEGLTRNVTVTGNLIVDACKRMARIARNHKVAGIPERYLLLTMHRQENVDEPTKLELLRQKLSTLKQKVVFPVHPRTRINLEKYNVQLPENVIVIDAVGYLEFMNLLQNCDLVMTDSGGVTEESIILRKPCITLRHSTARWETVLLKANILFPLDRKDSLSEIIETMMKVKISVNPYGENVAEKTSEIVSKIMQDKEYVHPSAYSR
jgi:UDP-N-acetylglucosamine 2-epimerase